MRTLSCLIFAAFFLLPALRAQDPTRFQEQVDAYLAESVPAGGELIVFTGSSSVRMWRDLAADFPEQTVINRGFGGSQMSDLLHYADELILRHRPAKVFIYEGDNDIAAGKKAGRILRDAKKLRQRIHNALPDTELYFLAAKPSLARWELKEQYEELNGRLAQYAAKTDGVTFVDVWTPMLGADGRVLSDIFIDDGLHLNRKGYDIWKEVIEPHVKER